MCDQHVTALAPGKNNDIQTIFSVLSEGSEREKA